MQFFSRRKNELTDEILNVDVLIVFMHGSPDALADPENNLVMNQHYSFQLSYSNAKTVLLISCNAGHYDHKHCIARYISNRTSGKVFASDGTVYAYNDGRMKSVGDLTWKQYRLALKDGKGRYRYKTNDHKRKDNYGWVMFQNFAETPKITRIKNLEYGDMFSVKYY